MAKKKDKDKKSKDQKPKVHKDLEGFEVQINEFGEIVSNFKVEKINEFLDENVEDKKLMELAKRRREEEE